MTLVGKKARYYDLSALVDSDGNALLSAAHFYGGNGFTTGVYLPLLTKLSEQFTISSLAMRGYWHDLPTVKKLTREEDADILIDFLEKNQDKPIVVLYILRARLPLPLSQLNAPNYSHNYI